MDVRRTTCVLLLLLTAIPFHGCHAACSVNVNSEDMPWPQPLLLSPDADGTFASYLAPDVKGNITVNENSQVLLACPGVNFKLFDGQETVRVTCKSNTVFTLENVMYTFNSFACNDQLTAVAETTEKACGSGNVVNIFYNVTNNFYQLIDVCFDTKQLTPLFSHATIVGGIRGFETSVPRPSWQADDLYGEVDMVNQYKTQWDTLYRLVGANRTAFGTNNLTKGHLVARADFSLAAQQNATFFYFNSAPQWSSFNGGNWNQLELDVRYFASANNFNLEVYTGTHGILKFPDSKGNQTEIYLYSSKTEKKVPVPMLFWKIVYEPKSKKGMVFVGVNNPLVDSKNLPPEYRVCEKDVCNQVDWLHWKPSNAASGVAYCCEYDAFRAKVPSAPQGLLVSGTFSSSGASSTLSVQMLTILISFWLAAHHLL